MNHFKTSPMDCDNIRGLHGDAVRWRLRDWLDARLELVRRSSGSSSNRCRPMPAPRRGGAHSGGTWPSVRAGKFVAFQLVLAGLLLLLLRARAQAAPLIASAALRRAPLAAATLEPGQPDVPAPTAAKQNNWPGLINERGQIGAPQLESSAPSPSPRATTADDLRRSRQVNHAAQQQPERPHDIQRLMELRQRYMTNRAISDRAYYILLFIYALFITFGTVSNGLICLMALLKPKVLSPRNIFIVNLAGSDLLLCVFTMPFSFIAISMKTWQIGGATLCKLAAGLQATSIFVSTISITAIAVDRYKVIVYPTHQETASGSRSAYLLLGSVWIGALILSSPLFGFMTIKHVRNPMANEMAQRFLNIQTADLCYCYEEWPFEHGRGIYSVISMIFQYVLPITIVSVVYAKISDKLQKRLIRRQRSTQLECQQKRQLNLIRRTHTMLVSVSLVFGLSWLPLNLFNVISDFSSLFSGNDQMSRILWAVCHLIGCSSACSNPVLYGFLNENFRKEMHQVYTQHGRSMRHHLWLIWKRLQAICCRCFCCCPDSMKVTDEHFCSSDLAVGASAAGKTGAGGITGGLVRPKSEANGFAAEERPGRHRRKYVEELTSCGSIGEEDKLGDDDDDEGEDEGEDEDDEDDEDEDYSSQSSFSSSFVSSSAEDEEEETSDHLHSSHIAEDGEHTADDMALSPPFSARTSGERQTEPANSRAQTHVRGHTGDPNKFPASEQRAAGRAERSAADLLEPNADQLAVRRLECAELGLKRGSSAQPGSRIGAAKRTSETRISMEACDSSGRTRRGSSFGLVARSLSVVAAGALQLPRLSTTSGRKSSTSSCARATSTVNETAPNEKLHPQQNDRRSSFQTMASAGRQTFGRTMRLCLCISEESLETVIGLGNGIELEQGTLAEETTELRRHERARRRRHRRRRSRKSQARVRGERGARSRSRQGLPFDCECQCHTRQDQVAKGPVDFLEAETLGEQQETSGKDLTPLKSNNGDSTRSKPESSTTATIKQPARLTSAASSVAARGKRVWLRLFAARSSSIYGSEDDSKRENPPKGQSPTCREQQQQQQTGRAGDDPRVGVGLGGVEGDPSKMAKSRANRCVRCKHSRRRERKLKRHRNQLDCKAVDRVGCEADEAERSRDRRARDHKKRLKGRGRRKESSPDGRPVVGTKQKPDGRLAVTPVARIKTPALQYPDDANQAAPAKREPSNKKRAPVQVGTVYLSVEPGARSRGNSADTLASWSRSVERSTSVVVLACEGDEVELERQRQQQREQQQHYEQIELKTTRNKLDPQLRLQSGAKNKSNNRNELRASTVTMSARPAEPLAPAGQLEARRLEMTPNPSGSTPASVGLPSPSAPPAQSSPLLRPTSVASLSRSTNSVSGANGSDLATTNGRLDRSETRSSHSGSYGSSSFFVCTSASLTSCENGPISWASSACGDETGDAEGAANGFPRTSSKAVGATAVAASAGITATATASAAAVHTTPLGVHSNSHSDASSSTPGSGSGSGSCTTCSLSAASSVSFVSSESNCSGPLQKPPQARRPQQQPAAGISGYGDGGGANSSAGICVSQFALNNCIRELPAQKTPPQLDLGTARDPQRPQQRKQNSMIIGLAENSSYKLEMATNSGVQRQTSSLSSSSPRRRIANNRASSLQQQQANTVLLTPCLPAPVAELQQQPRGERTYSVTCGALSSWGSLERARGSAREAKASLAAGPMETVFQLSSAPDGAGRRARDDASLIMRDNESLGSERIEGQDKSEQTIGASARGAQEAPQPGRVEAKDGPGSSGGAQVDAATLRGREMVAAKEAVELACATSGQCNGFLA